MRSIVLSFAACLTLCVFAQQPISLPKDNGKTTSFCESMELAKGASSFYDSAITRVSESKLVKTMVINGNETVAYINYNQMGQGIFGKFTFSRSGKYVNYCIQDFRVNGKPLEEWLENANATIAEQVKSSIFSTSVLLIASMKGTSNSLSQR